MTKSETLQKYEMVLIVNAQLSSEQKDKICQEVVEAIKKVGGNVINSQIWIEKQKLTFEIAKCSEGTYYLINFEGEGNIPEQLHGPLKLNEHVLRTSIIQPEN